MTGTAGDSCGEHYSRLIRELCALLLTVVSPSPAAPGPGRPAPPEMSPAAAASMLLGASMALMLCGSVTFAIGFLLVPWVAGIAMLFGLAGAVSTLSSGFFGKPAALPCKDATRGRICSPIGSDMLVA
ncbi:unnamed protein product [Urochloa decumbens]|uniref:Uncharacterized protein n=1 Tax=Urochloa decumbens TaxID=240449 RepID=A0ABC8Z0G2_9POAL